MVNTQKYDIFKHLQGFLKKITSNRAYFMVGWEGKGVFKKTGSPLFVL